MSTPAEGLFQIFSAVGWSTAAYTMRKQTSAFVPTVFDVREDNALPTETNPANWQNKVITGADSGESLSTSAIPLQPSAYAANPAFGFALLEGPVSVGPLYNESTGALLTPSGGAGYGIAIIEAGSDPSDGTTVIQQEFPTWSDQRTFWHIRFNTGSGSNPVDLDVRFVGTTGEWQEEFNVSATVNSQADVDSLISDAMVTAASSSTWATVTSGTHSSTYGIFAANATAGLPCYPSVVASNPRISVVGSFGGIGQAVGTVTRPASGEPTWINNESVSVVPATP